MTTNERNHMLGKHNGPVCVVVDRSARSLHVYLGPLAVEFVGWHRPSVHWGGDWRAA